MEKTINGLYVRHILKCPRTLFLINRTSRYQWRNLLSETVYKSKHVAAMSKTFISMLAVAVIVGLSITLISSEVSGQRASFIYEGTFPLSVSDPPTISFSIENGSVLYASGNVNLGLDVNISPTVYSPQAFDTLQTLLATLTSVSYQASWQDNQTTEPYSFTIPTPAVLTGIPPNSQSSLSYNLTNIPYGHQQIEVTAFGGGYVWEANSTLGALSYNTFSTNSQNTLDFTVEAPPATSMISPENQTYSSKSIPFLFSVNGDYATLEYSLDNLANVTIAGNTTLTGLSYGSLSLVVYADDAIGNVVASKTIYFTIAQQGVNPLYLFPILAVVFVIVLLIALIIYRKRQVKTKLIENK